MMMQSTWLKNYILHNNLLKKDCGWKKMLFTYLQQMKEKTTTIWKGFVNSQMTTIQYCYVNHDCIKKQTMKKKKAQNVISMYMTYQQELYCVCLPGYVLREETLIHFGTYIMELWEESLQSNLQKTSTHMKMLCHYISLLTFHNTKDQHGFQTILRGSQLHQ